MMCCGVFVFVLFCRTKTKGHIWKLGGAEFVALPLELCVEERLLHFSHGALVKIQITHFNL